MVPFPDFAPRPWPQRLRSTSPLRGRRVLIVAGDQGRSVAELLGETGASTQVLDPLREPPGRFASVARGSAWEVLVLDPGCLDEATARELVALSGEPPVLVVAGDETSLENAGAAELAPRVFAHLARPVELRALTTALGGALERVSLEAENRRLREHLDGRYSLGRFVTRDPSLRRVLETAASVADSRANVLLLGETGTGKTMLAHSIHQHSARSAGPFVAVHCGALPDQLLESELFGHVRGAFTGASRDRTGRFEAADGGTLFLDEIDSATLDLQVKLLRVIQERTFERVGDSSPRTVDVRMLFATHRDLRAEIEAGRFREDLFWRIHVVSLEIPALRERPGDVPLLAEALLSRYAREYGRRGVRLSGEAMAALVDHPWPGNVRQLENVLERAVLVARGPELGPADLGPEFCVADAPALGSLTEGLESLERLPPLKEALEGPERRILERALELCGGNRKKTAEMLAVNRSTLFNKMRKYGLLEREGESGSAGQR